MSAQATSHPLRFLTPADLPGRGIHYNINHLRRLWKSDQFPRPTYLSARRFAWPESEIDDWIAEKIAASKGAA